MSDIVKVLPFYILECFLCSKPIQFPDHKPKFVCCPKCGIVYEIVYPGDDGEIDR